MRKSVGAENTFAVDLTTLEDARQALAPIVAKVASYCAAKGIAGRTVTLKVKFADFEQITRSRSMQTAARTIDDINAGIEPALVGLFPTPRAIRLLGVALSALEPPSSDHPVQEQMTLSI